MELFMECLPVIALAACLAYLCIAVKARGFLFIISVIYLSIQIAYKVILLFVWQTVAFGSTDLFSLIGAGLTILNYLLMLVIFIHILRHRAQYSTRAAHHGEPDEAEEKDMPG